MQHVHANSALILPLLSHTCSIVSADFAIKILAYYALYGVTTADAEHAGECSRAALLPPLPPRA